MTQPIRNLNVINVNGLSKTVPLKPKVKKSDSDDLVDWFKEQEVYFNRNKIFTDNSRINHIILNLHVRYFGRLENYYKYNQAKITYDSIKSALLNDDEPIFLGYKTAQSNDKQNDDSTSGTFILDPKRLKQMTRYKEKMSQLLVPDLRFASKIDPYIEKLSFEKEKIDLTFMISNLKDLRFMCNGAAKDSYLITKLLTKVIQDKRQSVIPSLLAEIRSRIESHKTRLDTQEDSVVGKKTKKDWEMLSSFLASIEVFLLKYF